MASGSTLAVYAAIVGNSLVMVAKFAAFAVTGSGAMLSEGIHSAADVGNQCLLALGIHQSHKIADEDHPYGYAREQFVWALISAVGLFFLGCGVTVYHGIHTILHPVAIEAVSIAFWVLLFSFIIEGGTLAFAYQAVRKAAKAADMSFGEYVVGGPDPMGVAVLLEDGAAVAGVTIAASCLGMAQLTGNPVWDGIGSISIGILLGFVAVFLIYKNREALIGISVAPGKREQLAAILASDPVVESFHDIKATMIGAESVRFKAEIEFDGRVVARRHINELDLDEIWSKINSRDALEDFLVDYGDHVIDALAEEIDRLEDRIREAMPEVQHVDLEAD